jgi:hypothetical protein
VRGFNVEHLDSLDELKLTTGLRAARVEVDVKLFLPFILACSPLFSAASSAVAQKAAEYRWIPEYIYDYNHPIECRFCRRSILTIGMHCLNKNLESANIDFCIECYRLFYTSPQQAQFEPVRTSGVVEAVPCRFLPPRCTLWAALSRHVDRAGPYVLCQKDPQMFWALPASSS